MVLLTGEPRSAHAQAMHRTDVLTLNRQAFRSFLLDNPLAALHTTEALSQRLRRTTESAKGRGCGPPGGPQPGWQDFPIEFWSAVLMATSLGWGLA